MGKSPILTTHDGNRGISFIFLKIMHIGNLEHDGNRGILYTTYRIMHLGNLEYDGNHG